MNKILLYAGSSLAAALACALSVSWWKRWCLRHGVVDNPGHRKIHFTAIPLAGGLAVLTGLVTVLAGGSVFLVVSHRAQGLAQLQYGLDRRAVPLLGIVLGGLGMLWLGLRDDGKEMRAAPKFFGQLLVALVVAAAGIRITLFVNSVVFSYAITCLWILTVVNAFNFMDNMNGLCTGLGLIGGFWLGCIAAQAGQYLVAGIAFMIAGALLGFLPFNFPRATAFLGDSGSHLVGYLLAVLGILPHFYTRRHPHAWAVFTPLLVLAVPLGDMAWVVLQRWRKGQPFYVGDTTHLSHRLMQRNLAPWQAVSIIWLLAALAGGLAFVAQ